MSKIQIKKQANNTYRFTMRAGNGQVILTSESFHSKEICLDAIKSLRTYALDKDRYQIKKSMNLKHYFNLTDAKGGIIGSSELFESSSGRDMGIELVKLSAPVAVLEDLT